MSSINPFPEPKNSFLGIDSFIVSDYSEPADFEHSNVVILPIPYDSTTSYAGGTKGGPEAIIRASQQVEFYDAELDYNLSQNVNIFTEDGIAPDKSGPEKTLERINDVVGNIIDKNKFLVSLGGEHSITAGIIRPFAAKLSDLTVVQFDAHTDLRDQWQGTRYSHACALRRVRDVVNNTIHIGIRNPGPEEVQYIKENKIPVFYAHKIHDMPLEGVISQVIHASTENIYITFDVDCFDPSIMPTTGTPVPGGLNWRQATKILRAIIQQKNLVGFDVVELISGNHATEFLTASLVYKILGYKFCSK